MYGAGLPIEQMRRRAGAAILGASDWEMREDVKDSVSGAFWDERGDLGRRLCFREAFGDGISRAASGEIEASPGCVIFGGYSGVKVNTNGNLATRCGM